jgi:short-subunit dehydrogenase involved in D-alanine esterification of teichoic acids
MQRLSLIKDQISKQADKPLRGKTVVITGASRGIGLAIGLRCAQDGANVAILAKTTTPQPTLEGFFIDIQEPSILLPNKSLKQAVKLSP